MTQEHEDTRAAWDKIAVGYDKTNTETQQWLGNESLRRDAQRPDQHRMGDEVTSRNCSDQSPPVGGISVRPCDGCWSPYNSWRLLPHC